MYAQGAKKAAEEANPAKRFCPKCGAEYLPCEIFLPDYLLGKAKDIIKDEDGKILDFGGLEPDLSEKFECEYCKTSLKISARVWYSATLEKTSNFDEEYVSSIHKDSLELSEE